MVIFSLTTKNRFLVFSVRLLGGVVVGYIVAGCIGGCIGAGTMRVQKTGRDNNDAGSAVPVERLRYNVCSIC